MTDSTSPDWKRYVVRQRRPLSGCVPTGYEMLLRAANIEGVDLDSFQDDFDLDQRIAEGVPPRNNFDSVAHAVRARYPHLVFRNNSFLTGADKRAFVEGQIVAKRLPILVSIYMPAIFTDGVGWHIMPLVEASADELTLLLSVLPDGRCELLRLPKRDFVRIHDHFPGGKEIAYLHRDG